MFAALALIPLRDWCWAALAAALLGGGLYAIHHEREIGAQKVVAADAKVAQAQVIHNTEVTNRVKTALAAAEAQFTAARSAPTLPAPSIVCVTAARYRRPVSSAPSTPGGSDVSSFVPEEATVSFDPAPAVLAIGRDADAQVALLQATIKSYQAAGVVAAK